MNGTAWLRRSSTTDMLNKDGMKEYHGSNHTRDYLPDIITNRTLEFIEKAAVWRSLKVVANFVHVFPEWRQNL